MATPPHAAEHHARLHPTILIGYGSYGRRVLCRLLLDAEPHGLLTWEDAPEAGTPSARRLKDLVLVHVSDQSNGGETDSYIAQDLFMQIEDVPANADDLKRAVIKGKEQLLDEASRSADPARHRLGMDVFVLAQPTSIEDVGTLERILPATIQEVASDASLRQPAQGAALVNFTLFFDFENFWEQSQPAQTVRREIRHSISRWEQRTRRGLPSFGRIYLLDGRTSGGNRTEVRRIEELTLFLEFLLFAGMRDDPGISNLYQVENDQSAPLATFGIRLIERSRGLLKRLAAAYFSLGWIGHMVGSDAGQDARAQVERALEDFHPDSLSTAHDRQELDANLQEGLHRIEEELAALAPNDENWPMKFRECLTRSSMHLKNELANWARERAQHLAETKLHDVPEKLRVAVTNALHHEGTPAPLGAVVQELKKLENILRKESDLASPAERRPDNNDGLETIDDIHCQYSDFKRSLVNPGRLSEWWILLAVVVTAAWTPLVVEGIADFTARVDASTLPIIFAPLLGLMMWLAGRYGFHRSIEARVERGLLTFTHPDRGWIISRVRGVLYASQFRASLEEYADQVFQNMVRRLRGIVQREIHRSLQRLESRRKEMEWLRSQLRSFLVTYGLDPDKPLDLWNLAQSQRPGYRHSLETAADIQKLLASNPATTERYESTQARLKPFTDWANRYDNTFLYPVVFLENLSHEYEDPSDTGEGLQAKELDDFLTGVGEFSCAMEWNAGVGPGLDVVEPYCVLPNVWRLVPGIENRLTEYGIPRQRILTGSDPSRLYMLRCQLRVSPERLKDSGEV